MNDALKRGVDASDDRMEESLYHARLNGNVTAMIFYLKNRRPDRWRDVQHIDQVTGHYIISDEPMTEQEWIEARAEHAMPVVQALPEPKTQD